MALVDIKARRAIATFILASPPTSHCSQSGGPCGDEKEPKEVQLVSSTLQLSLSMQRHRERERELGNQACPCDNEFGQVQLQALACLDSTSFAIVTNCTAAALLMRFPPHLLRASKPNLPTLIAERSRSLRKR